ncbi:MAG TPA: transglycosylase domain-containing protein, partial [Patescibacteria group bacterium]|nr:transglycosylase domain-containing protein [Patescibacteria group bacterium]
MPIPKLTRRGSRVYGEIKEKARARWLKWKFPFRGRWKMPRLNYKKIAQFMGLGILACFVLGTGVVAWVSRDLPDPNKLGERQVAQSTKIYDRTGEHLLYEVYQDEKRTVVELNQVAQMAVKATIAVEDKHFYEHKGIRILSILRAIVSNVIN